MILSMTGFSSTTTMIPSTDGTQVQVALTLKSLNSRFLEANCKLPYAFTHLETEIIKHFKAKLIRGNIYFTLHISNPQALTTMVEPALPLVGSYIESIKTIQKQFNLSGSISVSDVLLLPSIFQAQERQIDEASNAQVLAAVDTLISQLTHTRIQEGLVLAQDLHQRITTITSYLKDLTPRAQAVIQERKQQLMQTITTALATQSAEAITEAQNLLVYNQLEKLDIHEEIVRFTMHLDKLAQTIDAASPEKGKKLDFILQELFREINTIASKCSDGIISSLAINIKVELEKAREQAQNIV